ncbi:inorganic diphosphatase [Paraburkholderia xenovorans]
MIDPKMLKIGDRAPAEFNVFVEITAHASPVKYELDTTTGILMVDRYLDRQQIFPIDYGFIPQTLAGDGKELDVMVLSPCPLMQGSMLACRALGCLMMEDEDGLDTKILAAPAYLICGEYATIRSVHDVDGDLLTRLEKFFSTHKKSNFGRWSEVEGWRGKEEADQQIASAVSGFFTAGERPQNAQVPQS